MLHRSRGRSRHQITITRYRIESRRFVEAGPLNSKSRPGSARVQHESVALEDLDKGASGVAP